MTNLTNSLSSLPPKQALILLLAEKARRQQLASQHSPQAPHLLSDPDFSLILRPESPYHDLVVPARYKIYYGGRDSAKSWSFAEALIRLSVHTPVRILCTREFQTSIKDSVHRLLKDTIARLGMQEWFEVTDKSLKSRCGAEFIFKGIRHYVSEVKSTEGIDIVWIEEAHNTSEESFRILIPTIRKENSEIWISFNVTDVLAPVHQRFVVNTPTEEADGIKTFIHHVNYDANPFLTETSRKEIEYLKRIDYEAYQHVYLGLPLERSQDVIFGGRYIVQDFPDDLWKQAQRLLFGADWGFAQDPSVLIRGFIYQRCLYIEYEAWQVGAEFAGNMAEPLEPGGEKRGELEQLFDQVPLSRVWPIKGDSARPETISFMRGKGFHITDAEKWKGSVEDGISHIKGFEKIIIHPRCKHTELEARLYKYKRDKLTNEVLPVIIDKHNHTWDAIRYMLDGYIKRTGDLGIWARLGKS